MTATGHRDAVYSDLAAEQDRLDAVLGGLAAGDWDRPSAAAGWRVRDVVLHLAQTEELVIASAKGEAGSPFGRRSGGESIDDLAGRLVTAERGTPAAEVYQRWRTARRGALDALRACPPGTRLPWATIPLSPTTLATTRLAEHWAHGLDITGPLGISYPDTGRLRHVAWLAIRTLPYAFAAAGQTAPGTVRCSLTAPDDSTWELGPDDAASVITGPAGAFCRVAAHRLDAAGSGLTATGPDGAAALRLLRTYAA
ncbi:MAG TPA: maleylpyruvate isomerase family mycothiol-dependent enzyme [Streptosporangiaceae bacterium]|jgi:uncharacterized protein (TIGR03084 family)